MTLLGDQDPNKDNKDNPEWMKTLPEDLGKAPALAKFKPAENEQLVPMPLSVAKSYVELEKKMGDPDSIIRIPGEKATPEERDAFQVKLGRPPKQEEYELPGEDPKNEAGKKINDRFRAVAFKHGVSKAALKDLGAEMQAIATEFQTKDGILAEPNAEGVLQGAWKNDYSTNLKKVATGIRAGKGGEKVLEIVNNSGLGANTAFLEWMLDMTRFLPAETMKGIEDAGGGGPALTREKLLEMKKDPKYLTDPEYRKQVEDGYAKLFPGQKKIAAQDRHEHG